MADIPEIQPIKVIPQQSTGECIAVIQNDIRHIREAIDAINARFDKQEEIINRLQTNCNREERWKNIRDKVEDLDVRMTKIEKAKCPKSHLFDDLDARLRLIEKTHQKDEGATIASTSTREYILFGLTLILGALNIWQFLKGGL